MPLSEHEQRLLDQIERALYADDPKFADSVRSTDLHSHYRRRLIRAVVLGLLGLLIMLSGIAEPKLYLYMGVAGFLIMFLAAWRGLVAVRRLTGRATPAATPAAPAAGSGRERVGVRARFEERWRRRFEDREDRDDR